MPDGDSRITEPKVRTVSDMPELEIEEASDDEGNSGSKVDDEEEEGDEDAAAAKFTYLTNTPVSRLTVKFQRKLEQDVQNAQVKLEAALAADPRTTWARELDELEAAYAEFMTRRKAANRVEATARSSGAAKRSRKVPRKPKKKSDPKKGPV